MLHIEEYTDPPDNIVVEQRDEYIYVLVESKRASFEMGRTIWKMIAKECESSELLNIMMETRMPNTLTANERFLIRSELVDLGFSSYRIAVVDEDPQGRSKNEYADAVSATRGILTRAFMNFQEAEDWLLERDRR